MKKTAKQIAALDAVAERIPLSKYMPTVNPMNPMSRVIPVVVTNYGEYKVMVHGKPVIVVKD